MGYHAVWLGREEDGREKVRVVVRAQVRGEKRQSTLTFKVKKRGQLTAEIIKWANDEDIRLKSGAVRKEKEQAAIVTREGRTVAQLAAAAIKALPTYEGKRKDKLLTEDVREEMVSRLKWWSSMIGDLPVRALTNALVRQKIRDHLGRPGKPPSRSTIVHYIYALNTALRIDAGLRGEEDDVRVFKHPKQEKKQATPAHTVIHPASQLPAFLAAVRAETMQKKPRGGRGHVHSLFYDCIIVSLATGVRQLEGYMLKVYELNLTPGEESITVTHGDGRTTKAGVSRVVSIKDRPVVIEVLKRRAEGKKPGDWLFPRKNGTPMVEQSLQKCFKNALKAAELTMTWHKLRHTFATYAVIDGLNVYTVQQELGHEDSATTQIYANLAGRLDSPATKAAVRAFFEGKM
jgi:integrase